MTLEKQESIRLHKEKNKNDIELGGITNAAFDGGLDLVKELPITKSTKVPIEDLSNGKGSDHLRLTWSNLTYEVKVQKFSRTFPFIHSNQKRILQPQSGQMSSGELVALMGPSGAGKSTLLNCLTARYVTGVGGTITVTKIKGKKISFAVVPQQDALFEQFTVREELLFASQLKNPTWRSKEHQSAVDRVISDLNLENCVDTRVGNCSGGQQRRVSIGVELVSRPDFLILDEPTSGLDSANAELCVQLLRDLATQPGGPCVLATIHQPSADILELFHRVYLMSRHGSCLFYGPPGQITDYLAGYGLEAPDYCNPADYALEVANGKFGDDKLKQMQVEQKSASELAGRGSTVEAQQPLKRVVEKMRSRPLPWFKHLGLLATRSFQVSCIRSSHLLFRVAINAAVGLLLAFLWTNPIGVEDGCWASNVATNLTGPELLKDQLLSSKSPVEAKQEYLDKVNTTNSNAIFLFSAVFFTTVVYLMSTVLSFPLEVATVKRELSNSWYKASSYFVGKTIADVPPLMLSVLCLLVVAYPLSGQIPVIWRFGGVYVFLTLLAEVCESIGMFFGVLLAHDMVIATLVTMASFFPVLMFGGFLVKASSIPWYFKPLTYTSYARYAYESILVFIYGFGRCANGSAISQFVEDLLDAKTPIDVLKIVWEALEITYKDAPRFANVLKVPAEHIAAVINATSEYLGYDFLTDYSHEYNETSVATEPVVDSSNGDQPSYILYFFEVNESIVLHNLLVLCAIIVWVRVLTFGVLCYKTRTGK